MWSGERGGGQVIEAMEPAEREQREMDTETILYWRRKQEVESRSTSSSPPHHHPVFNSDGRKRGKPLSHFHSDAN